MLYRFTWHRSRNYLALSGIIWHCSLLFNAKVNIASELCSSWKYRHATSTFDFNTKTPTRNSRKEHVDRGIEKILLPTYAFFFCRMQPSRFARSSAFIVRISPAFWLANTAAARRSALPGGTYPGVGFADGAIDVILSVLEDQLFRVALGSSDAHTRWSAARCASRCGDHRRITARYRGVYFERFVIMRC